MIHEGQDYLYLQYFRLLSKIKLNVLDKLCLFCLKTLMITILNFSTLPN